MADAGLSFKQCLYISEYTDQLFYYDYLDFHGFF